VISVTKFFGIVFQGNPRRRDADGRSGCCLIGKPLQSHFVRLHMTTPVQQIAPRKSTGAGNVTRKTAPQQRDIELSQPAHRTRFQREPEMQHGAGAWGMNFSLRTPA
jgi:hypothetical protein